MSKIRKHSSVHGKGGGCGTVNNVTFQKKPKNLRPIAQVSADAGAWITDNPLYLLAYTGAILALMYILKLIFN